MALLPATLMPHPMRLRPAALVAFLALAACAPTEIAVPDTSEVAVGPVVVPANENLHAVLWTQAAAEYRAVALQTFAAARAALGAALEDPVWTAAPEQVGQAGFEALSPAVVLDVDETVLDNSAYQARLIQTNESFSPETWKAWVEEEAATPVPGALAFTRAADSLGVAVVYLTNRRADEEAATRANLEALGFPVSADFDAVLTRGETPDDAGSDKGVRLHAVARQFRVLALLGDNLGDFLPDTADTVEERAASAAPYERWWGRRWFMLPNPQYGGWEGVLFGGDYSLSREERIQRKMEALDPGRD